MTSHSDNQCRKKLAGKFPTSPFSSYYLQAFSIHSSLLCSLSSLHCLICFPRLKSPSVCRSSSYPSHHASLFSVTHARPPSLHSSSLYNFDEWVYIFHLPWFSVPFNCTDQGCYLCITEEVNKLTVRLSFSICFCKSQSYCAVHITLSCWCVYFLQCIHMNAHTQT